MSRRHVLAPIKVTSLEGKKPQGAKALAQKIDAMSAEMRAIAHEYHPEAVEQAISMVGNDPVAVRNLLEANRKLMEKQAQDEFTANPIDVKKLFKPLGRKRQK